jgi:hypothetical protein
VRRLDLHGTIDACSMRLRSNELVQIPPAMADSRWRLGPAGQGPLRPAVRRVGRRGPERVDELEESAPRGSQTRPALPSGAVTPADADSPAVPRAGAAGHVTEQAHVCTRRVGHPRRPPSHDRAVRRRKRQVLEPETRAQRRSSCLPNAGQQGIAHAVLDMPRAQT